MFVTAGNASEKFFRAHSFGGEARRTAARTALATGYGATAD